MEKTVECSLDAVDVDLRKLIQPLLEPGEEILVCFRVEYHMVWVELVTSRQVIVAKAIALRANVFSFKPKIEMPHISALLLTDIDHSELAQNQEYELFTVSIFGKNGSRLEANFTLESAARKFLQALSFDPGSNTKQSTAGRLQELSSLLQQGLITEQEYQKKRSDILSGL